MFRHFRDPKAPWSPSRNRDIQPIVKAGVNRGASCPAATARSRPRVDSSLSIELSLFDCDSQAVNQ
jgi:hypothetical protein